VRPGENPEARLLRLYRAPGAPSRPSLALLYSRLFPVCSFCFLLVGKSARLALRESIRFLQP
jgi:hypothetical protein